MKWAQVLPRNLESLLAASLPPVWLASRVTVARPWYPHEDRRYTVEVLLGQAECSSNSPTVRVTSVLPGGLLAAPPGGGRFEAAGTVRTGLQFTGPPQTEPTS